MARLEGKPVDKAPNYNIVMNFAAKRAGVTFREYVTNYKIFVDAALDCAITFGIDVLSVISDPMREAEGFGSQVVFPENDVPYSPVPLLSSISDINKLRIPASGARMEDRFNAVGLFKERAGDDYPIIGWVEGPIAQSCILRGMQDMMADMLSEPEAAEYLMDICTQQAISFAKGQIACGADIVGVGDAAASLIGPALYEEFVLPREKQLINAIHEAGAKVKLHICGNITSILPLVAQTGADIVDIDWMVPFGEAIDILGNKGLSVCGNFDPVEVLLRGNPQTVHEAVKACLRLSNSTTAIAAGCEVPRDTPYENLLAVHEALNLFC